MKDTRVKSELNQGKELPRECLESTLTLATSQERADHGYDVGSRSGWRRDLCLGGDSLEGQIGTIPRVNVLHWTSA